MLARPTHNSNKAIYEDIMSKISRVVKTELNDNRLSEAMVSNKSQYEWYEKLSYILAIDVTRELDKARHFAEENGANELADVIFDIYKEVYHLSNHCRDYVK